MKRAFIISAIVGLVLLGAIILLPSGGPDWAEITLESVSATQDGQISAKFNTRHSNGGGIGTTFIHDNRTNESSASRAREFPFVTPTGSETTVFHLNPEREPVSGNFTNSPLFSRLLMHVGETRRFVVGQPFVLYDFNAGGKRYACIYRAVSRDEPWEDPSDVLRKHQKASK